MQFGFNGDMGYIISPVHKVNVLSMDALDSHTGKWKGLESVSDWGSFKYENY